MSRAFLPGSVRADAFFGLSCCEDLSAGRDISLVITEHVMLFLTRDGLNPEAASNGSGHNIILAPDLAAVRAVPPP